MSTYFPKWIIVILGNDGCRTLSSWLGVPAKDSSWENSDGEQQTVFAGRKLTPDTLIKALEFPIRVSSFVSDVAMPLISALIGCVNFFNPSITLREAVGSAPVAPTAELLLLAEIQDF